MEFLGGFLFGNDPIVFDDVLIHIGVAQLPLVGNLNGVHQHDVGLWGDAACVPDRAQRRGREIDWHKEAAVGLGGELDR